MATGTILKQCNTCQRAFDAEQWSTMPIDGFTLVDDYVVELRTCSCGSTMGREVTAGQAFAMINAMISKQKNDLKFWQVIRAFNPKEALDMIDRLRPGCMRAVCYPSYSNDEIAAIFGRRMESQSFFVEKHIECIIADPDMIRHLIMAEGGTLEEADVLVIACSVPLHLRKDEQCGRLKRLLD